jgi:hypothetical protein
MQTADQAFGTGGRNVDTSGISIWVLVMLHSMAIGFLGIAVWYGYTSWKFFSAGDRAPATVIALDESYSSDSGITYSPVFEYQKFEASAIPYRWRTRKSGHAARYSGWLSQSCVGLGFGGRHRHCRPDAKPGSAGTVESQRQPGLNGLVLSIQKVCCFHRHAHVVVNPGQLNGEVEACQH